MAKINKGILGGIVGKIGNVVGGRWKEVDYIRAKVIPANPNTIPQQTQRNLMKYIVGIVRPILGSIINIYWDPFARMMSGYNACIKQNIKEVGTDVPTAGMKFAKGSLASTTPSGYGVNTSTHIVTQTWAPTPLVGNQLATDKAVLMVFYQTTKKWYVSSSLAARSTGTIDCAVPEITGDFAIEMYFFFGQWSGTHLLRVSDSYYTHGVA